MKRFLNNHAEKIGFLIGLSFLLLATLEGNLGKILFFIALSGLGFYIIYSVLKNYGWKINLEKNLNKTTFRIQIPNLTLYNIFFYLIFISSVVLWIVTGNIAELKYLSDYFFFSIFIIYFIHIVRKWILKKRKE
jgi:hypothetical protein